MASSKTPTDISLLFHETRSNGGIFILYEAPFLPTLNRPGTLKFSLTLVLGEACEQVELADRRRPIPRETSPVAVACCDVRPEYSVFYQPQRVSVRFLP